MRLFRHIRVKNFCPLVHGYIDLRLVRSQALYFPLGIIKVVVVDQVALGVNLEEIIVKSNVIALVGNIISKALHLAGVGNQVTIRGGCFFNLEAVARPGDLPNFKAVLGLAVEQGPAWYCRQSRPRLRSSGCFPACRC